eukprot:2294875-Rhodomonas_salina.2
MVAGGDAQRRRTGFALNPELCVRLQRAQPQPPRRWLVGKFVQSFSQLWSSSLNLTEIQRMQTPSRQEAPCQPSNLAVSGAGRISDEGKLRCAS